DRAYGIGDGGNVRDAADLVVREHRGDKRDVRADVPREGAGAAAAGLATADHGKYPDLARDTSCGGEVYGAVEDGVVRGSPPPPDPPTGRGDLAEHREVVGFRSAGGEHDLGRPAPEVFGEGLPGLLHATTGAAPRTVEG